jgi:hypothetical protein
MPTADLAAAPDARPARAFAQFPTAWRFALRNQTRNRLAGLLLLEWFPSFGPMQFAAGGAYGHTTLWGHLLLGLAWTGAFTAVGLVIFRIRTRSRRHPG